MLEVIETRRDYVRAGVAILLLGAVVFVLGILLGYTAYGTLIRYAEDPWTSGSTLVRAYEEMQNAELVTGLGFFTALIGIAIAFYGMMLEPSPVVTPMPAPQPPPWQQTEQQQPQQYPPQP